MNLNSIRSRLLPAVCLLILHVMPAPRAAAGIEYVLHITVDGLRGDLLKGLVEGPAPDYPHFRRLRAEGASTFNARCDYDYSETLPNHCSMITGRPVNNPAGLSGAGHRYNMNSYSSVGGNIHKLGPDPYLYKVSTFDTAHDRGLSTALYAGKSRLNVLTDSYSASTGRPDTVGMDNGKKKIDFVSVTDLALAADLLKIQKAVVSDITALPVTKLRNYSLIHFTDTDTGDPGGGHYKGWGSPAWNGAVKSVDGYLGAILAALEAPETDPAIRGKVAILLTSDHGGGGPPGAPGTFGSSHTDAASPLNYTIPMFLWGPGIPAGVELSALFRNRADPGGARPGMAAGILQPLRNADTANIAMSLLGLPWIEGSHFKPEFAATPSVIRDSGDYLIRWPLYLTNYRLQSATDLTDGPWITGTHPVTLDEMTMTLTCRIPALAGEPRRFWRLKAPE